MIGNKKTGIWDTNDRQKLFPPETHKRRHKCIYQLLEWRTKSQQPQGRAMISQFSCSPGPRPDKRKIRRECYVRQHRKVKEWKVSEWTGRAVTVYEALKLYKQWFTASSLVFNIRLNARRLNRNGWGRASVSIMNKVDKWPRSVCCMPLFCIEYALFCWNHTFLWTTTNPALDFIAYLRIWLFKPSSLQALLHSYQQSFPCDKHHLGQHDPLLCRSGI